MRKSVPEPPTSKSFDALSIENRYALDLGCALMHSDRPRNVAIQTVIPEAAVAAVSRLQWVPGDICVDSQEMIDCLRASFGDRLTLTTNQEEAESALVLYSALPTSLTGTHHVVQIVQNALSHKSLRTPRRIRDNALNQLRQLERFGRVEQRVGVLTPPSLALWLISMAAGTRRPALHFRASQAALDRVYDFGQLWWTGAVTVIAARRDAAAPGSPSGGE